MIYIILLRLACPTDGCFPEKVTLLNNQKLTILSWGWICNIVRCAHTAMQRSAIRWRQPIQITNYKYFRAFFQIVTKKYWERNLAKVRILWRKILSLSSDSKFCFSLFARFHYLSLLLLLFLFTFSCCFVCHKLLSCVDFNVFFSFSFMKQFTERQRVSFHFLCWKIIWSL